MSGRVGEGGGHGPLHKKGARDQANNFRGVCLLRMCSRVLGRVIAKRVGRWAEHLKLLDEKGGPPPMWCK